MSSLFNNSIKTSIILVGFAIITTSFFSYIGWDKTNGGRILKVIDIIIILYYIQHIKLIRKEKKLHFTKETSHILYYSFFSIIGGFLIYGNNPINSAIGGLDHSFILIYFILYFNQVQEEHLIKVMLVLTIIITSILFIQQITFPFAPFGLKSIEDVQNPNDIIEIRNGLIRYRIASHTFLLFTAFFYWDKLSRQIKITSIIAFGIAILGIYLLLTKQLIATAIITISISILLIRNTKIKVITFCLLITLCFVGFIYKDILFGEMIDSAKEQASEDDIRVLSAYFFLDKILSNPIGLILGNGYPTLLEQWGERNGYWVSDVGIIGETFLYGIIYISVYIQILWKTYKYRKRLPLYIKMYIISTLLISIMIFPYRVNYEFITWAIVLYICDLYINKSPLKLIHK